MTLNWGLATATGTTSPTSTFTRTVTFNPTVEGAPYPNLEAPLRATVLHQWNGRSTSDRIRGTSNNGLISTFNVGGIGQVGYGLYQQIGPNGRLTPTANDYQAVQFTFSEALTNLSFSITDIDRTWTPGTSGTAVRDFIDGVSLTSNAPFTASRPTGSTVIGAGTVASPWQNSENRNASEDGPGGQIDIHFTAPVTSFTIRYQNLGRTDLISPSNQNNDQAVFITGFTTNRPVACQ